MSYRKRHVKTKIHSIKPKKRLYKRPAFWILLFLTFLFISVIYILLFFPGTQVKNIIISGNEKVSSKDIEDIALTGINKKILGIGNWGVFTRSIFFVNSSYINSNILKKFPIVEKISLSKKYPESIVLGITERKPVGIFCQEMENANCFLIDENGVIFEATSVEDKEFSIIRQSIAKGYIFVGEEIINRNIVESIIRIEKNLKENFQINVEEALISNPSRLDIKTNENWYVYFDLTSDISLQILKMDSLFKNEISQEERQNLQYIDLRFKDKAYYK